MAILLGLHLCRRAGIAPAWPPWPKIRRCVWKWSLGFVQKWGINACACAYVYIYIYNYMYTYNLYNYLYIYMCVCVLYCLCISLMISWSMTPILQCWNILGILRCPLQGGSAEAPTDPARRAVLKRPMMDTAYPIGSMVLVYLPTKLGHLWGKCW